MRGAGISAPLLALFAGCAQTPAELAAEPSLAPGPGPSLVQEPEDLVAGQPVALAYSGYRTGQHPDRGEGEVRPTPAQIREDLDLLAGLGVRLIRQYDAGPLSQEVLRIIEEDDRPIRVVQGAWLRAELSSHETCAWVTEPVPPEDLATHRARNEAEVERVIELARAHPEVIAAVNVGNEALVTWNDHLVSIDAMVGYLDRVGRAIDQPVTTADNYVPWAEHAEALAPVVDFAFVHTYPVWEGRRVDEAIAYTRANLARVRAALPDHPIAIGEAGWPSVASEFGERATPAHQARHLDELLAFGRGHRMTVFVFEAFDEDWKGDANPNGAEKHWGVYRIDRTPKPAAAVVRRYAAPAPAP